VSRRKTQEKEFQKEADSMKKLTDKSKRTLTIAGIGVVCVALVVGIFYRFHAQNVKSTDISSSTPSSNEVVVAAVNNDSVSSESSSSTASSVASSSQAEISDQKIQPDVSKPSAPSSKPQAQGNTSDSSKTPSYSSQDTSTGKSAEPSGGEKKDGKIYVPGFGWVTDNGGGGSGSTASDMYENGNKVGQMD
jgi:cytoskeletal protein RodZ